ncbi:hypothetical protein COO60DRAFT_1697274, partial [Scenedesmus sp. NREL 46B-D3]
MDDLDGASSDELPPLDGHTDSEQGSDDGCAEPVGTGHAVHGSGGSTTSSSTRPSAPSMSALLQQGLATSGPLNGSASSSSSSRMMDGLNCNSRIWQVPEGDDPHQHALGPAPDDEEHRAAFQMPRVQLMPGLMGAGGGQAVLSMQVPAALASMRNAGRSTAPEPMFVPGGGTSGPPPFQGILGSMTVRPPQQQQQQRRQQPPIRAGVADWNSRRDHLANMMSNNVRQGLVAHLPEFGGGNSSNAAAAAARSSDTATRTATSSSNNTSSGVAGRSVSAGPQAAGAAAPGFVSS